jgi:hypothetical protein
LEASICSHSKLPTNNFYNYIITFWCDQEIMLRHDTSLEVLAQIGFQTLPSSQGMTSAAPSPRHRQMLPSVRPSERSAGAISIRLVMKDKQKIMNEVCLL